MSGQGNFDRPVCSFFKKKIINSSTNADTCDSNLDSNRFTQISKACDLTR